MHLEINKRVFACRILLWFGEYGRIPLRRKKNKTTELQPRTEQFLRATIK